ncbi:MAG: hypothetical protein IJ397_03495 [Lachnospiraceae bacterium]|nr:hypothetical protein [Lachnospiraceae bacterium]
MKNNPGLGSVILGAVMNVVNLGMVCAMFSGIGMLYGGIFVIFPILGITNAVKGIKMGQGPIAIVGLVLNIFAVIGAAALALFGIVANASA